MWFESLLSSFGLFSFAFMIWMIVYCLQNDPDRFVWLWVIILFGPLGASIYFLVRYLPNKSLRPPRWLSRFFRGKKLKQLEWKCRQIGNAHQWVEYGDALRDVGRWQEADAAYTEAVERDNESLPALWGLATTAFRAERFSEARDHLMTLLQIDERYKFGDPSLLLGKTHIALDDSENAQDILSKHVTAHRTPEAVFLLGKLQSESGDIDAARETLQSLIDDLENAPRKIVRKSMFWRSRAKRLMRTLA